MPNDVIKVLTVFREMMRKSLGAYEASFPIFFNDNTDFHPLFLYSLLIPKNKTAWPQDPLLRALFGERRVTLVLNE